MRHLRLVGVLIAVMAMTISAVPALAGTNDDVGLFDESLNGSDDWEMWARIATRFEFRYLPEALSYTRLHPANTSTDVERMRSDSMKVQGMLFADPAMTRGLTPRELARLRRKGQTDRHHHQGDDNDRDRADGAHGSSRTQRASGPMLSVSGEPSAGFTLS